VLRFSIKKSAYLKKPRRERLLTMLTTSQARRPGPRTAQRSIISTTTKSSAVE